LYFERQAGMFQLVDLAYRYIRVMTLYYMDNNNIY